MNRDPNPRYARRGTTGPWHLLPADRHGTTTCGRRLLRYTATTVRAALPDGDTTCPACTKHHAAGTYRPVGR